MGLYRKLAQANPRVYGVAMGDSYYTLGMVKQSLFDFSSSIRFFQLADSSYSLSKGSPHAATWGERARERIREMNSGRCLRKGP